MKKLLTVAFLLFLGVAFSTKAYGQSHDIPMQIIDESEVDDGSIKGSHGSMVITQDDNILTLPTTPVDYTLQLRDENGTVIYSAYIPAGTTQIILPTTLSGTFEIRLVASTYYYVGYITLY